MARLSLSKLFAFMAIMSYATAQFRFNLSGMKAYPKCGQQVADRAIRIFNKCQACIQAIIFDDTWINIPGFDASLYRPKCPKGCCVQRNLNGATGHFISCSGGCCSRVVSFQLSGNNTLAQRRFILKSVAVINNEYTVR